jgi:asparagine synthase (glutamine-hydrolysing)
MCGICGEYNPAGVQPLSVSTMLDALTHRGPDDEGLYCNGVIGLGNRRLSIIDLQGGHQPISNEDKTIWIVFNGEIYNYNSLRSDLLSRGHKFQTQSDTEVIIHLYEQFGDHCVSKLRGMFSFALWDEKNRKLLLARDHLGQKPLYYMQEGERFLFASEIKAIRAISKQSLDLDYESIHHYLSLRFIPAPNTMLCQVKKLPPGHFMVLQNGQVRNITRYWDLNFNEKTSGNEDDLLNELQDRLIKTVDLHLVSDVPVGAYLSGGLDSSLIVAIMAQDLKKEFQTFAVGVSEQDYNELPYARLVADKHRTDHIERTVEANLIQMLPTVIWHLDEPSDPIAACMFHAAELASQHVKVVLSGDGGDELFAGFDRYMGLNYLNNYSRIPAFIRHKLISPTINFLPESFRYKSLTQKFRWVHTLSTMKGIGEQYAGATLFFRFSHQEKSTLFNQNIWSQLHNIDSSKIISEQFYKENARDPIDRMLYADYMTRLPEHSLMLSDRMTMAHGLEARAPFLDFTLVEFMATLPSHLKIRNRTTKYIMRKLAENYLPEKIIKRQKQGFIFPIAYWFRDQLFPFIKNYLLNSHYVNEGIFQREYVTRLLEEHKGNKADHHVRLWMLLNLEIWHQLYIEGDHLHSVQEKIRSNLFYPA